MKFEKGDFVLIAFNNYLHLALVDCQKTTNSLRYFLIKSRGIEIYKYKLGLSKGIGYQTLVNTYNKSNYPNNQIGDTVTEYYKPSVEYINSIDKRVYKLTVDQAKEYIKEYDIKNEEHFNEFVSLIEKYK